MSDFNYDLSWKAAFKAYTIKQLFKDSIIPLLLAILFTVLSLVQDSLLLQEIVVNVCNIMITLLPAFISILLAAFAIWISFFLSKTVDFIQNSTDGIVLLNELNASFLIEIAFSIVGMLFTLSVYLIAGMDFKINVLCSGIVNVSVLFLLLFVCFAVIWWLVYIAKNLHNVAKFKILYERIQSKKKGKRSVSVQKKQVLNNFLLCALIFIWGCF